jgi:quinol monooxygenase YgiN
MIVVRFKVTCKPDMIEDAMAAFKAVVAPSRMVEGVVNFDVAQDITDPNSLIATEVFVDEEALERQESLPEVQNVINLLPGFLAAEPEATIYDVSSSRPWG